MTALHTRAKKRVESGVPVPVALPMDHYELSALDATHASSGVAWHRTGPIVYLSSADNYYHSFAYVDLLRKALLDAMSSRNTSAPITSGMTYGAFVAAKLQGTAAQQMIAELRDLSGLTNEEIGPLLGVSRRSVQAWIAGGAISARKEMRMRDLLDAIRRLAGITAVATRSRLLNRPPHSVSAYDLLAEERYDAAIDVAFGRHPHLPGQNHSALEPLATQLDRIEDIVAPALRLNRKLSGPLRR